MTTFRLQPIIKWVTTVGIGLGLAKSPVERGLGSSGNDSCTAVLTAKEKAALALTNGVGLESAGRGNKVTAASLECLLKVPRRRQID